VVLLFFFAGLFLISRLRTPSARLMSRGRQTGTLGVSQEVFIVHVPRRFIQVFADSHLRTIVVGSEGRLGRSGRSKQAPRAVTLTECCAISRCRHGRAPIRKRFVRPHGSFKASTPSQEQTIEAHAVAISIFPLPRRQARPPFFQVAMIHSAELSPTQDSRFT